MVNMREHILKLKDRKQTILEIPEWDVTDENGVVLEKCIVVVKSISAGLRARIIDANIGPDGRPGELKIGSLYPDIVAGSVYYPEDYADKTFAGKKMFDILDIPVLEEKNAEVVERIVIKSMEVSGMTANAVDDEAKNSSETPTGGDT